MKTSRNKHITVKQFLISIRSACLSPSTAMVYITTLIASVTGKNNINASITIIFLFIFLRKPNIILVTPLCSIQMVQYQLPMGLWDAYHRRGWGVINKDLGNAESTLAGILEKQLTKTEAYAGIAEQLVRYLAIEEALQDEIKRHNRTQKSVICRLVCYIRQGGK